MSEAVCEAKPEPGELTRVMVQGDLAKLTEPQRAEYYGNVCNSLGLNPLTRPFDFIVLNGKMQLYTRKDCTDQLRKRDRVSVQIVGRDTMDGVHIVTARATLPDGRTDESSGAVPVKGKAGEDLANAIMKCETKAKRRVTLSICGLGFTDESELDSIPAGQIVRVNAEAKSQPVAAITNGEKTVVGLATKPTREAIAAARPAWMRSQGVDPNDAEAVKKKWSEMLEFRYGVKTTPELLERDAAALLTEIQRVGHTREVEEVFGPATAAT